MKKKQRKQPGLMVRLQPKTHERLSVYVKSQPMAPAMTTIVSTLVDRWLDEQATVK